MANTGTDIKHWSGKSSEAFGGAWAQIYNRTLHQPLDLSQVYPKLTYLYDDLNDNGSTANLYKGQLLVVTSDDWNNNTFGNGNVNTSKNVNHTYSPFDDKTGRTGPYLIYGYTTSSTSKNGSYYADRILTYTELQAHYVRKYDLGSYYTGVGEWYQLTRSEIDADKSLAKKYRDSVETFNDTDAKLMSYAEIFNDYIDNVATGSYSHAEGFKTTTTAYGAHAEGIKTSATGIGSHAEGELTVAHGTSSHSEGRNTYAGSDYSHAEGQYTVAHGLGSHSEGSSTYAFGNYSHSGGIQSYANGDYSFAHGSYTISELANETAIGKYNGWTVQAQTTGHTINAANHSYTDMLFEVGNGTSHTARYDAFAVGSNGNTYIYGDLYVDGKVVSIDKTPTFTTNHSNSGVGGPIYGVSINSAGALSYITQDLTVSTGTDKAIAVGDGATELSEDSSKGHRFVTGITQNTDGKITYQVTDIYTPALSLATGTYTSGGDSELIDSSHNFIDGMFLTVNDHQIKLTYHYANAKATETHLSIGTTSGNFITGTTVSDHNITHTYGNFSNNGTTNGSITNVNISSTGQLTYTSENLSMSGSGNFLTAIGQNANGKITTATFGSFSGSAGTNSATNQTIGSDSKGSATFLRYTTISSTGAISGTEGTISHATSGVTSGNYGSTTSSPGFSGTFDIPRITVNDCGHITSASNQTITMPSQSHHGGSVGPTAGHYVSDVKLSATGSLSGNTKALPTKLSDFTNDVVNNGSFTVTINGSGGSSSTRNSQLGTASTSANASSNTSITVNNVARNNVDNYFSTSQHTTGGWYVDSDINYKEIINDINVSIDELAKLPIFDYIWKPNGNTDVYSGTSAQAVEKILPNIVGKDSEGIRNVDYGSLGTIIGITACKEIVKLRDQLNRIEKLLTK